jgi:lysyl-tRNA synthetase class 2
MPHIVRSRIQMQPDLRSDGATERPNRSDSTLPAAARFWAQYRDRVPSWIATLTSIMGVLNMIVVLFPAHRMIRVREVARVFFQVPVSAASATTVAVGGLLLWGVGSGLRRRKRRAWRLAIGIYLLTGVAHILHRTLILAAISLLVVVLLLVTRNSFKAMSDPVSRRIAPKIFGVLTLISFSWGMLLLTIGEGANQTIGKPSIGERVQEVLLGMVGVAGPLHYKRERWDDILHGTLLSFTIVTVVLVFFVILRSAEPAPLMSADDDARLRELLDKQGFRDSLGYFALRPDKHVVWSPSGKAAIAGKVINNVFIASGDPLGDPEAWPGAIDAYMDQVAEHGWVPAVIGCSETGATIFKREADLSALELGDEAIVYTSEFTLEGRPMRGVRQAMNRVERAGYSVTFSRSSELTDEERAELARLAVAWRADSVERGFSMASGRIAEPQDPDSLIVRAWLDGEMRGLLAFAPWGPDGISLDMMRRDRTSDNGLNEFMIAKLMSQAKSMGIEKVSLNFMVFRDALERGERIGAGPIIRAWRWILVITSKWFQVESLYRFNVKFRPEWEPRYVMFPSTRDIPRIAVALMQGEGFLARPHRIRRWLGRP